MKQHGTSSVMCVGIMEIFVERVRYESMHSVREHTAKGKGHCFGALYARQEHGLFETFPSWLRLFDLGQLWYFLELLLVGHLNDIDRPPHILGNNNAILILSK